MKFNKNVIATLVLSASTGAMAQEAVLVEEVVVTGIRASLESALQEKRASDNLVEVIQSEDIGKLPDQNLAEVLENITGIQITRTAGVGTGVQIRGTNANRVEINGVSTVGSGSGRSGIDFEDVNASIISAVEVTKASEAKTIEGSVGGTVNLRTIRPLDLKDTLVSARIQGEESSLSSSGTSPRFSGAWGDNWETDAGTIGVVISGSYTEQEAVSFRPRADFDNLVQTSNIDSSVADVTGLPSEFLGVQFLVQEQENDDYETVNLATTFEWAPSDNLKFHVDAIINEQERSRDQYRLQASGISNTLDTNAPSSFTTVDFGTFDGGITRDPFQQALTGNIEPNLADDPDDGNLRFTTETGSRVTDSEIFSIGGEWTNDQWTISGEIASTSSETFSPTLNTTLNFLNPGSPLAGLDDDGNVDGDTLNDNAVPFMYDLTNGPSFAINFDSPLAPTPEELTDPSNVVLDQVDIGRNTTTNEETAVRLDFSYDLSDSALEGITSVDFGYRKNRSSSRFEDIDDRIGGFSRLEDSPSGALFSDILVEGASNFGDADGRDLFIADFLLVDPDLSFSNPDLVLNTLTDALDAHRVIHPNADGDTSYALSSDENAFYNIEEETNALYVQANFDSGIFRGNFGVRYLETDIDSTAFGPEDATGARSLETTSGSYSFVLPRFNLVAEPMDDVIVRLGFGEDIRRPNFNDLNTAFTLSTSENAVVSLGNPGLEPEEVVSIDASIEWYFAPAGVLSVGIFEKNRTNLFGSTFEGAALLPNPADAAANLRETDPSCPGGGIYNPVVQPNVLGDPNVDGLCVGFTKPTNDPATTTQSGIELTFQYDLSSYEDTLGWASGFGLLANYTRQSFSGGSDVDTTSGRGLNVLGDVSLETGLLDFSENAYNITTFYEKNGLSARLRYTWREAFRTRDYAGGANSSGSSTFSFPVVTGDRGQLNASVSYQVNDQFSVGVEATNLTDSGIEQNCVATTGPLCFVGLPDRRVTFGVNYRL